MFGNGNVRILQASLSPQVQTSSLERDALIIDCTRTRTLLWFGHKCCHHRVHSNTIVIMVWAWISTALEHERYYGLGVDALIIDCTRTRRLLWFGHGCSSNGMLLETKQDSGCFRQRINPEQTPRAQPGATVVSTVSGY